MKLARFLIYGLQDPITLELRYIGKSSRGMHRPQVHLKLVERPRTHKQRWINRLIRDGQMPLPFVLEELTTQAALDEAERFWIAYWRSIGARLTNATDGGDGWALGDRNPMHNPVAKARFSAANKGRKFKPAHKENHLRAVRRPEVRAAHAEGTRRRWEDPEYRRRMSEVSKRENARRWADPEYCTRVKARIAEANRRRAR